MNEANFPVVARAGHRNAFFFLFLDAIWMSPLPFFRQAFPGPVCSEPDSPESYSFPGDHFGREGAKDLFSKPALPFFSTGESFSPSLPLHLSLSSSVRCFCSILLPPIVGNAFGAGFDQSFSSSESASGTFPPFSPLFTLSDPLLPPLFCPDLLDAGSGEASFSTPLQVRLRGKNLALRWPDIISFPFPSK